VLRAALLTGHLKADHVAGLFGMHCRTLHRRLSECGTGFQRLVNESRFAFAQQLLQDSTRAFQRWSGTTPAAWRAQVGDRMPRRT
jgi:AraC-like DNA-binding protein